MILNNIMESGAGVNTCSENGETALMRTAWRCDIECIYQLLRAGADVNIEADDGSTALLMEVEGPGTKVELIQCIKMLFRAGAHVNRTNKHGLNALESYISRGKNVNKNVAMVLFAGGETVDVTSEEKCVRAKKPAYLLESQSDNIYLMNICRDKIREHLLQMSPVNLFIGVPQLGLPPLFTDCLLYWRSLSTVRRKRVPFRRSSSARSSIDY